MALKETFQKQGGMNLIRQYAKSGVLGVAINQFLVLGKSQTALEILRLSTQMKNKQKLEKKYEYAISKIEKKYESLETPIEYEKKIWICWLQGIENAPDIVKKCYESIRDNISDREIVLITDENYRELINFPPDIQAKIDDGIITGAHMTDLLRLELLTKYGGTWIDATVYCSSSQIPLYMLDSDLFMFQDLKPGRDGHTNVVSNWFITSSPNNKMLFYEKELLYEYWRKNNKITDYFIFHEFFSILIDKFPEEWNKVIPFSNSTPHILLLRLFEKYDDDTWKAIKEQTSIHKLSYKLSSDNITKQGTYYDIIFKTRD